MHWGGQGGEGGRSALVLDAACLHPVLHYVSLSHISILSAMGASFDIKKACGKPYIQLYLNYYYCALPIFIILHLFVCKELFISHVCSFMHLVFGYV